MFWIGVGVGVVLTLFGLAMVFTWAINQVE